MERFIPMVEEPGLRDQLTQAIDGKGAFRRFKDVLMAFAPERERWFAFRSERLRVFMEAWLSAHGLRPITRAVWAGEAHKEVQPISQDLLSGRRSRSADTLRKQLREIADTLGARDLEKVTAFAEFVKARRAARSFVHRFEGQPAEGEVEIASQPSAADAAPDSDDETPSSRKRTAALR
jgi:hypothetical protein